MNVLQRHNVTTSGSGDRAMMFAHGFGCDQNMWRFVAPAFEDDFRVVLFDHVGAGAADLSAYSPEKYASLDGYADDVVEIGRALGVQGGVFVGHSVSAMVGVLAAKKAPELFDGLVLLGPSPRYIDDNGYTGGSAKRRSTNSWSSSTAITWGGRGRWRRSSWATLTDPNSATN